MLKDLRMDLEKAPGTLSFDFECSSNFFGKNILVGMHMIKVNHSRYIHWKFVKSFSFFPKFKSSTYPSYFILNI